MRIKPFFLVPDEPIVVAVIAFVSNFIWAAVNRHFGWFTANESLLIGVGISIISICAFSLRFDVED